MADCYCSLVDAIKEQINADETLSQILPTSEDPEENHVWEEGQAHELQALPYATIFPIGKQNVSLSSGPNTSHFSHSEYGSEAIRIRVYDDRGRAQTLTDSIKDLLHPTDATQVCLCVGRNNICCFKLQSSLFRTIGNAQMSEIVMTTFWETI